MHYLPLITAIVLLSIAPISQAQMALLKNDVGYDDSEHNTFSNEVALDNEDSDDGFLGQEDDEYEEDGEG